MKRIAYVVVHGFGGVPENVTSIKEELKSKNIDENDIFTPLLLGHGKQGIIKLNTKFEDIVYDLKKYVERNCFEYEKIVLIGYSMGGLIAMSLTLEIKIDVLILINAPMHIWTFKNFIWTIYNVDVNKKFYHIKTVLSSAHYNKVINSIELKRLQKYVKCNLNKITSSTYIIQSKHDYVAKPESANEIYDSIGAEKKEILWSEQTSHFIPDEEEVKEIIKETVDWVEEALKCPM